MIEKARQKHDNFYNYDSVKYESANEKVVIGCPLHGEFYQLLRKHANGQKCPKCAFSHPHNRDDLEAFKRKAAKKHSSKYDYSITVYKNSKTKVEIICNIHGIFRQEPMAHLSGSGCPKCRNKTENNQKIGYKQFLERARQKHGEKFEYHEETYVSIKQKIAITCPIHGFVYITPRCHLTSTGCKLCTKEEALKRASKCYILDELKINSEYEYIRIEGKRVLFKCKIHGLISQNIQEHLRGAKCRQCAYDNISKNNRNHVDIIKQNLSAVHKERYAFNLENYRNSNSNIEVICKVHGKFYNDYKHLMRGQGCPKCKLSSPHMRIIDSLDGLVPFELNDRKRLNPYELDVYVPNYDLGIEVHGLYWHSFSSIESRDQKYRHAYKADLASSNNVRLFQFFENEINEKLPIVSSMIKVALGRCKVFYARKCGIRVGGDQSGFFEENHLYGYRPASVSVSLVSDNVTLMVVSFSHVGNNVYEIMRSATLKEHLVVGGFDRIISYFIRNYKPAELYSYCDRRFSTGESYRRAGFTLEKITGPGYFYVKGDRLFNRRKFQKHKLPHLLDHFDLKLTEAENMFSHGFRRLWDAGHFLFRKTL